MLLSVDVVLNMHIDTREFGHKTQGFSITFLSNTLNFNMFMTFHDPFYPFLSEVIFHLLTLQPHFLCIFTTQDPKRTSSRYLSVAISLMIKLYNAAKHWCLSWCRAPKESCLQKPTFFRGELWLCFLFQGKDLHHCWFTVTYLSF